ncbi:MAG: Crp/Fnr family transcriptional regulator [Bacteroidales bacterium]|nr:Crp/Fnr family transcriptional regulator [Bacteroidales bacterium]
MDDSPMIEQNSVIPFGNLLEENELQDVIDNSNVVNFNKKEIIFRQNTRTSHIMYIKSGLVKIFKEGRNGKYIILKVALPEDFLGLLSIYGGDTHQYSVSAIQPSEICFVDINVFNSILKSNGAFSSKIIGKIANDGLFIFERLMSQSHKQLPGRIADVILYFAETIYGSESFEFPFTRRELAELAGTTKESFIRTLAEFKHDKIIDLEGSMVKINSMKIVKTLSDLG